jgi:subtilase family serine protease
VAALEVAYTVSGSATPGSDYVALPGFVTIPEGAVDATVSVAALDDSLPEPSESVIVTVLATPAYDLGSPSSGTVSIVSDDVPPDLTMTALGAPSSAAAGSTITVSATVKNQGAGAAGATQVLFYLSTNTTWEPGDVQFGNRAVSPLAPNTSEAMSLQLTIPATTPGGTYFVLAKADGLNEIEESNETNNVRPSTSITIGPDLIVAWITAPLTATPGSSITLTDATRNQGVGAAAASTTSYYLSTNLTLEPSDVLLGSRAVNPLNIGLQHTGSATVMIPPSTANGTYYVIAQADSASVVSETIETNNLRYSDAMKIGVDLSVTVLSMPGKVGAGDSVNVSVTTANLGGMPSPESITRLYFSVNQVIDASDALLAARTIPPLAGATSNVAVIPVVIPASAATGGYYVIAAADAAATIVETDETNNLRNVRIYVGPDLTITSVGVPPGAEPGGQVSLTDTTQNIGGGLAPATQTAFYLSTNTVLDASDIFLGTRTVPPLGTNVSNTATTTFTVPPGTPLGSYYVFVDADHSGTVGEIIETNNLFAGSLVRVGPDLSLTLLTAPSTVGRGIAFTVTDTTRNDGSLAAESTTSYYLSSNATLDASDILLGSRPVGALATGMQATGQASLTVPATQTPGNYYIIAKADGGNVVAESAEGNNSRYLTIRVNP